jgi:hypothetical protein
MEPMNADDGHYGADDAVPVRTYAPDERMTADLAGSRGCGGITGGDQRVDHLLTSQHLGPAWPPRSC